MKKIWPWILGLSLLLVGVIIFLFGLRILSFGSSIMYLNRDPSRIWPGGLWHHHGGMWFGARGMPILGLFGWLGMLIIPLGLFGLFILGIVLLVRGIGTSDQHKDGPQHLRCESCGRQIAADWTVCPYCGESLKAD